MNTEYRYQLESRKLTGRTPRKIACPECGRKKCFVRYVDTRNDFQYLSDEVGKCDHLNSCGYHYKPSEFFKTTDYGQGTTDNFQLSILNSQLTRSVPLPPFSPLPFDYVQRSHSPQSTFWQWFATGLADRLGLPAEQVQRVYEDYCIGATRWGCVIFWQIDRQGQVHGGHIMQYRRDGHRDGYQGWTHGLLIQKGLLPLDWQLYQCLFGEQLLPQRPEAHVCLVESEKTALIMAACQPDYLWLATSGSGGLNTEKVACLKGRRVTLFPDSGCYEKWQKVMQGTTGLQYNISDELEQYPANTDLADLLLQPPIPPPDSPIPPPGGVGRGHSGSADLAGW